MRLRKSLVSWLYVAPLVLVLVPFFIVPIVVVLVASVFDTDGFGGLIPTFTLSNYIGVLTIVVASRPAGIAVLLRWIYQRMVVCAIRRFIIG